MAALAALYMRLSVTEPLGKGAVFRTYGWIVKLAMVAARSASCRLREKRSSFFPQCMNHRFTRFRYALAHEPVPAGWVSQPIRGWHGAIGRVIWVRHDKR